MEYGGLEATATPAEVSFLYDPAQPGAARATTRLAGSSAAVCAFFFTSVADILVFVYDFWAPTMIVSLLVALFWYHRSRNYAVVISMIVGGIATAVWRFGLASPGDSEPALFGFAAASVAFLADRRTDRYCCCSAGTISKPPGRSERCYRSR